MQFSIVFERAGLVAVISSMQARIIVVCDSVVSKLGSRRCEFRHESTMIDIVFFRSGSGPAMARRKKLEDISTVCNLIAEAAEFARVRLARMLIDFLSICGEISSATVYLMMNIEALFGDDVYLSRTSMGLELPATRSVKHCWISVLLSLVSLICSCCIKASASKCEGSMARILRMWV